MQNYLFQRAAEIRPAKRRKKKKACRFPVPGILLAVMVLCTAGFLLFGPWLYFEFGIGGLSGSGGTGSSGETPSTGTSTSQQTETTIPRAPVGDGTKMIIETEKGEKLSASEIYEKMLPSVVTVLSYYDRYYKAGSGVVLSQDGYIITNYHTLEGASAAEVVLLSSGKVYEAKMVGWSEELDIAVLKADADDLIPAEFFDSDKLVVGEPVYALGNPLGYLEGSITEGIVSAPIRTTPQTGFTSKMIQASTPINKGNSGGALINEAGQVVGITTAKLTDSKNDTTVEGVGLSVPVKDACGPINSIIANGRVITPRIGISCYEVMLDGQDGLLVYSTTEGEPAAQAGIRSQDVIIAADGKSFVGVDGMRDIFYEVGVGNEIVLTVVRGAETLEISVLLIE